MRKAINEPLHLLRRGLIEGKNVLVDYSKRVLDI